MKRQFIHKSLIFISFIGLFSSACKKKKEATDEFADVKGNYFSINQFIVDQWNNFPGPTCVLYRNVRVNDKTTDSSYVTTDKLDWTPIFKTFAASDISDRKFLGKYKFTQFDDPQDETHNFFYQANDEDLFTQKLLITLDMYNMKVRGIYIETYKKTATNESTEKLYYAPLKTIQIQTDEKPVFGSRKHTVANYDFMR
jgi:hypothetical protein